MEFRKEKISTDGIAEVIVGKHRNGPTGSILLTFLKSYARFENPDFVHKGALPSGEEAPF